MVDPRVVRVYYTCMPEISYEQTIRVVAEHLAQQQAPSIDTSVRTRWGYACAYRGSNGGKCAVGIFLSDDTAAWADAQMVNSVDRLCALSGDEAAEFRMAIDARGRGLCRRLQDVHDSAATDKHGSSADDVLRWWRSEGVEVAQGFAVDPSVWTEPFDKALAKSRGQ